MESKNYSRAVIAKSRRRRTKQSCSNLYALILAGGIGSRFWPFSRELEPKQFLKITGRKSLLEDTILRLNGIVAPQNIYIISNKQYFFEIEKHIARFKIPVTNIILESSGKNTAPAIGLGINLITQKLQNKSVIAGEPLAANVAWRETARQSAIDPIFIILPADHYIKDTDNFKSCMEKAVAAAGDDYLVTIGIKSHKAATGYGYIKIKSKIKNKKSKLKNTKNNKFDYYLVEKFLEKPNLEKAKAYAADKNYFWNSGIFVWRASVFMQELKDYLPSLYQQLLVIEAQMTASGVIANSAKQSRINSLWQKIKPISVDYGIMEHSRRVALVPANFDWSDLGSWDVLGDLLAKNLHGNVIQADSIDLGSKDICIFSRGNRLIGTVGLKDLIIADTPDALLVCDKHKTQEVKHIVDSLKSANRREHIAHTTDKRPWGSYTVLQTSTGFKIKLVEIEPGKRLSLQRHKKRAEHWVVVEGRAKITWGDIIKFVNRNESIYIPQGKKHRLENPADSILRIVEVQTGDYLEENDIERFADDFNRE